MSQAVAQAIALLRKEESPLPLVSGSALRAIAVLKADFDESQHPRDENGRWTSGSGAASDSDSEETKVEPFADWSPAAIENAVIEEFGATEDPREAGYILEDGQMLDFSGVREGGMPGMRSFDHREVGRAFEDSDFEGGTEGMIQFMSATGATRISYNDGDLSVDTNTRLTGGQLSTIQSINPSNIYWTVNDIDGRELEAGEGTVDDLDDISRKMARALRMDEARREREASEAASVQKAEFNDEQHPRDEKGRFAPKENEFFHGTTTEKWASIKEKGLLLDQPRTANKYHYAGEGRDQSVYLSKDYNAAMSWADTRNWEAIDEYSEPMVLKVTVPPEHQSKVVVDENQRASTKAYRIGQEVPAAWISPLSHDPEALDLYEQGRQKRDAEWAKVQETLTEPQHDAALESRVTQGKGSPADHAQWNVYQSQRRLWDRLQDRLARQAQREQSARVQKSDFDEESHPRDEKGRFVFAGGAAEIETGFRQPPTALETLKPSAGWLAPTGNYFALRGWDDHDVGAARAMRIDWENNLDSNAVMETMWHNGFVRVRTDQGILHADLSSDHPGLTPEQHNVLSSAAKDTDRVILDADRFGSVVLERTSEPLRYPRKVQSALRLLMRKYDETQPRDEKGRWRRSFEASGSSSGIEYKLHHLYTPPNEDDDEEYAAGFVRAYRGDKQIGAMRYGMGDPGVIQIGHIEVTPKERRKGVGAYMVKLVRDNGVPLQHYPDESAMTPAGRAFARSVKYDEEAHPRYPAGAEEGKGGQFAPKDAAVEGSGSASNDSPKIEPLDQDVIAVGGDNWNRETAIKLEKDYKQAKPKLQAIEDKLTVNFDEDFAARMSLVTFAGSKEPESWDELTPSQQDEAKEDFIKANFYSEQEFFQSNWEDEELPDLTAQQMEDEFVKAQRWQGGPDDDTPGLDEGGWAIDAVRTAIEDWSYHNNGILLSEVRSVSDMTPPRPEDLELIPEEQRIKLSVSDILAATSYDARNNEWSFSDDVLVANYLKRQAEAVDPNQLVMFDGSAPDPEKILTPPMRDTITRWLKDFATTQAENVENDLRDNVSFDDEVNDSLSMSWDDMDDEAKFESAKSSGVVKPPEAEDDAYNVEAISEPLEAPENWDPLARAYATEDFKQEFEHVTEADYAQTKDLARNLQKLRGAELLAERIPLDKLRLSLRWYDDYKGYVPVDSSMVPGKTYGFVRGEHVFEGSALEGAKWFATAEERDAALKEAKANDTSLNQKDREEHNAQVRSALDLALINATDNALKSMWSDWKSSSLSESGRAIQLAAHEELGARLDTKHWPGSVSRDSLVRTINDMYPDIGGYEGFKAVVRATWETSQYMLDKAGEKNVQLYRAVGDRFLKDHEGWTGDNYNHGEKMHDVTIKRNGAMSTTTNPQIANNWGSYKGDRLVLRLDVPRTAIISVPAYGMNYHNEAEVVVMGTAWNKWDVWKGSAPSHALNPIQKSEKTFEIDVAEADADLGMHWLAYANPTPTTSRKYDENQPRAPKGSPNGGQFVAATEGGEAPTVDQYRRYDLPSVAKDTKKFESNAVQAAVANPRFRKWFTGSKVRDESGMPRVVYHGTRSAFDQFTRTDDFGYHFGDAQQANHVNTVGYTFSNTAKQYTPIEHENTPDVQSHMVPAFLSIKNPIELTDGGNWNPDDVIYDLYARVDMGGTPYTREDVDRVSKRYDAFRQAEEASSQLAAARYSEMGGEVHPVLGSVEAVAQRHGIPVDEAKEKLVPFDVRARAFDRRAGLAVIKRELEKLGFDGIRYKNKFESTTGNPESWIAFHPWQIKSALAQDFTSTEPSFKKSEVVLGADDAAVVVSEGEPSAGRIRPNGDVEEAPSLDSLMPKADGSGCLKFRSVPGVGLLVKSEGAITDSQRSTLLSFVESGRYRRIDVDDRELLDTGAGFRHTDLRKLFSVHH